MDEPFNGYVVDRRRCYDRTSCRTAHVRAFGEYMMPISRSLSPEQAKKWGRYMNFVASGLATVGSVVTLLQFRSGSPARTADVTKAAASFGVPAGLSWMASAGLGIHAAWSKARHAARARIEAGDIEMARGSVDREPATVGAPSRDEATSRSDNGNQRPSDRSASGALEPAAARPSIDPDLHRVTEAVKLYNLNNTGRPLEVPNGVERWRDGRGGGSANSGTAIRLGNNDVVVHLGKNWYLLVGKSDWEGFNPTEDQQRQIRGEQPLARSRSALQRANSR